MNEYENNANINITLLLGSIRPNNYTTKAANLVIDELQNLNVNVTTIDPAKITLPLPGQDNSAPAIKQMNQTLKDATAVIIASPEYHGSYSSVIKLVIDNLGYPSGFSGKPVALLGVAAGVIGAIKSLEHLRSVLSHVGAIVLPGPVSVANVQNLFDDYDNCTDPPTEKRIRLLAHNLVDHIHHHLCPRIALEQMVRTRE